MLSLAIAGRASAAPMPPAAASKSTSRRLSITRFSEFEFDIPSPSFVGSLVLFANTGF
jgi:hypothetical protein